MRLPPARGPLTDLLFDRLTRPPATLPDAPGPADDDLPALAETRSLAQTHALLARAELVRPQNYFDPALWHARRDTARTLLNRALGADHPGTFGIRRSFFLSMGGHDGDVLFENLELIRTVLAHGGHELRPPGLYVRRLPCDARRFWSPPGSLPGSSSGWPRPGGGGPAGDACSPPRAQGTAGGSGSLGARKSTDLCEPSQNGLVDDRPHRHSATVALPGSIGSPS